jgi:hypothetical protein
MYWELVLNSGPSGNSRLRLKMNSRVLLLRCRTRKLEVRALVGKNANNGLISALNLIQETGWGAARPAIRIPKDGGRRQECRPSLPGHYRHY